MPNENNEIRVLSKNPIEHFILRFDLLNLEEEIVSRIIGLLSDKFDRIEKKAQTNFEIKFTTDKSEVNKSEVFDFVLVNEAKQFSITFSLIQKAFWFETNNYINKDTYQEIILDLIQCCISERIDLVSKRIGMRFINKIKCDKVKDIKKYFNLAISKNLISRISQPEIARFITQEEYTNENYKSRIQYGIPNKFYPSIINNYDLLLDIHSYDNTLQQLQNWNDIFGLLNHSAYSYFVTYINSAYLQNLK
jgi:uncharacterized protein (TIGR04255 family)